ERHGLPLEWPNFLDDFQRHWPTDEDHTYVDFVRVGSHGNGPARSGNPKWRRLTEEWSGSAKSVFHFDVPGTVASSAHAGIPWLRFIREQCGDQVHVWPFDGWEIPEGKSAILEVSGAANSIGTYGTPTSTTPIALRRGLQGPTMMARSRRISIRH
ncbi:MAG TPA: hypothetical protein VMU33_12315, partial [Burkholderiaceae bacterium]|nr:hypothetical protein [Burkholderiaceae bacterium]